MLNITVDGGAVRFRAAGNNELLDTEMTCAGAAIIMQMAAINHCSFEAAALMLLQQSSILHQGDIKQFDINTEEK